MKQIVIKKDNNDIEIITPNYDIYSDEPKYENGIQTKWPYSEVKSIDGRNYFLIDFGSIDKTDIDCFEQLYWENDENGNTQIKKDHNWEQRLMPKFLIKIKHTKRLESKLDIELNKQTPDVVKIVKLQEEKEKIRDWDDKKCYEQALANLVEDGHNKQTIVEMLNKKIQELS